MVRGNDELTEDERKALRGSKFAPLPPPRPSSSFPRLAHPGGPVATNKAVALAKFLERKLKEPGGLDKVKPELIELAVKNAKETVYASSTSSTSKHGLAIRHVTSFDDSEDVSWGDGSIYDEPKEKIKEKKKKEKKKENKKLKNKKKKKDKIKAKDQ